MCSNPQMVNSSKRYLWGIPRIAWFLLKGDYALLGAGEPPHNGLLFAFKFSDCCVEEKYVCSLMVSNAFIESPFVDILIHMFEC